MPACGALILTRYCSFYWTVGLHRFWEVRLINSPSKDSNSFTSVLPDRCKTTSQSSCAVESPHPLNRATIPVFQCHYPPCQYIALSSWDMEDRLFPPSLIKPYCRLCSRIAFQPSNNMWEKISIMFICLTRQMAALHLYKSWNCVWFSAWRKRQSLAYWSSYCVIYETGEGNSLQAWNTWSPRSSHH